MIQYHLRTLRRYFLAHPRRVAGALFLSLSGLVLNATALALLAAMTQMVANAAGISMGPVAPAAQATTPPASLDINAWYLYLSHVLDTWLATRGLLATLGTLAGAYLLAMALYTVTSIGVEYLMWSTSSLAAQQMMRDVFAHLMSLSMDFFNRSRVGELSSRITHDIKEYNTELFKITLILITALPLAVFYWLALLRTSPQLTLASIAAFGSSYLLVRKIGQVGRKSAVKLGDALGGVESTLQESFSGITLVKAYTAEKIQQAKLNGELALSLRPMILEGMARRAARPINRFLQDIPAVLVLLYGAFLILSERLDLATLILVVYLMRQVRGPTTELMGGLYFSYQLGSGYVQRINELQASHTTVPDGTANVPGLKDTLTLANASFHYDESDVVLDGVNLTVHRGEAVALVGPSGAGKSTLVSLLLRFFDTTEGRVLLDGRDIRTFKLDEYRKLFGVVAQETILFNDSVCNNIAYAMLAGTVTEEDVVAAATIANAHDFISELPGGYDTIIGDRGLRLSGGQRQRLALARAVLRDPAILILDEATSSLDSVSEMLVQEAVERLLAGRTAVVIAHRLSTIRNADRIVVMDAGRIVQTGTHEQLLATEGLYRRLYESQYVHADALPEVNPPA